MTRRQIKWFLFATALYAATVVPDLADVRLGDWPWPYLNTLAAWAFPLAVGVAISRYRLYDIDRLISRTVSYGCLTASLLIVYLVVVALLRGILEPLTGTTYLAVAASTLAVAALFRPLWRRVQAVVDRRFDRARYDAVRTVDAYARRLRTDVDLETVLTDLRETVGATVGPQRVGLWLRASRSAGEP